MGSPSPMVSRQRGEVLKALGDDLLEAIPLPTVGVWRSTAETAAGKLTQRPSGHPPAHGRLPQLARGRRYRRGRESARGYYEDAYAFEVLARDVLEPLGEGGDCRYRHRLRDLYTDQEIEDAWSGRRL